MADDTERLFVQLEGRINDFEKKMKQAERRGTRTYNKLQRDSRSATRRMERDMTRASRRINVALASTSTAVGAVSRAFRVFTPLLAVAGIASFSAGVRGAVSDLSSLGKTARDVSLDVETLQGVQRGFARSANVTQNEVNASLGRFARRVGEAANGQGELNKFVEKYNIDLKDANGELKSQETLLRDIADVIRRAGSDQERLAIAQAAFGDTGRRLAQTLAGGAREFDRMQRAAEDAGQVIDRDVIARAEELDDQFDDLSRTLATGLSRGTVKVLGPMVEFLEEAADKRSDLADIFGSLKEAQAILGEDLFNELEGDKAAIGEVLRELRLLDGAVEGLQEQGRTASRAFAEFSRSLVATGDVDAARVVGGINEEMREAVRQFQAGEITAEEFAAKMAELDQAVVEAVEEVGVLDQSSLDSVRNQFQGLLGLVELLAARVRDLKSEASAPVGPSSQEQEDFNREAGARQAEAERKAARAFVEEQERRRDLTLEEISIEQEAARLRREAANEDVNLTEDQINAQARLNVARREERRDTGGDSGGGGGGGGNVFEREVAAIRERIAETEAEAAALLMAAGSNREYGAAIDFALQKARLMTAAQQAGLQVTPDLEAAIDSLASAYANAGERAEEAAENIRRAEEQAERGARALSQMFGGILTGATDAKEAMGQLLQRIAQVQIEAAFKGLSSGEGGIAQIIGKLLGFAEGGFTGAGGVNEPKGVVHGGEFVFSKKATQAIGVGNLDAMHRSAKGFASGGFVGAQGESGPECVMERSKR